MSNALVHRPTDLCFRLDGSETFPTEILCLHWEICIVSGVVRSWPRADMNRVRVFAGSPGDVPQERDIVSVVVEELRRTVAPLIPVDLETVRWETHAWPAAGKDAQDVINAEIGEYDVFVGIMWKRFGTRTKRLLPAPPRSSRGRMNCLSATAAQKSCFISERHLFSRRTLKSSDNLGK